IGLLDTSQDEVDRVLNTLLDAGVNVIDTAAYYKGSERMIGNAVAHRRDQFVLVSKCGTRLTDETDAAAFSPELITYTVDRALRNLRTDHLDVMLLHSCDLATLQKGDALGALIKTRDAGKVRHAGYAGDNDAAAWAAANPGIAVIETSVSVTDQANMDSVLPVARKHNVGVIAKRPIANAAWKDMNDQPEFFRAYTRPYVDRFQKMQLNLSDFGYDPADPAAWLDLFLRFTMSADGVHTAIVGTTKEHSARQNLEIADRGPLPPDAVRKVREAFRRADPAGAWKGET
ncbi:MAG: aldo/keto reductase, partial [Tepidisphaeraceae bacterium]